MLECSNNLRNIAFASTGYQSDSDRYVLGSRKNQNKWFRNDGSPVTLKDSNAYWGIYYTPYLGNQFDRFKHNFKCPEATLVKYIDFYPFGQYATYGFNGVTFSGKNVFFNQKRAKLPSSENPSKTAMIHDAWEPMMEGRGDTPNEDIKFIKEYRRHDGSISTLWLDGHHSFVDEDWQKDWYK